jgi:sugar/nucleoside kinase (ribokinase family)
MPHIRRAYLDNLADEILALGVAVAGFKLGEYGFYARATPEASRLPDNLAWWSNQQAYHPAFKVNVIGTTGAGDSAYAGFLAVLLQGLSLPECVQAACAAGACSVEAAGASAGILPWQETLARIQAGWPLNLLRLADV